MKVAVDVRYHETYAVAAAIGFEGWEDGVASFATAITTDLAADYVPGRFYERELPPLVELLDSLPFRPELVIVDAYVDLGEVRPGLGRRLHERIGRPVIGVAKTEFVGAPARHVVRGGSARPLYVTAAGLDLDEAARRIAQMHGPSRLPTILRAADRLAEHG